MSSVLLQRSVLDRWTAVAAKGSTSKCGSRVLFDTQGKGIVSWDEKKQQLLGDSVKKCT